MDSFRQDYAIYVKSGNPGSEVVERLDRYWDGADEPIVGDPEADGLSDTAAGNLILEVCWYYGPPLPWAVEKGIADLSIANEGFDPGTGLDVSPNSKVWKDSIHVRPASAVIIAVQRLIDLIESRHTEIARRVATGPKGHGQSDEDVMDELAEEFKVIQQHLEWANKNRTNAHVTMIIRQG
jgi:hypothetical protein